MGSDVIRTERLTLTSVGADFMRAALAGDRAGAEDLAGVSLPDDWIEETKPVLEYRLTQIEADASVQPWLLRLIVDRATGAFIGYVNFHAPPGPDGWVEIGYTIESAHRRRGYASEAALAFFAWAHDRGVKRFRASVGPWNEPSLLMVAKMGFERVGTQWDEIDGEEIVFEADAGKVLSACGPDSADRAHPRDTVQ